MIISFYFSYKTFFTIDMNKIRQRLIRILIPFIIIPIIDLGTRTFSSNLKILSNIKIHITYLLLQYLTGYMTYVFLWFLQMMIFLTLLFIILFYFCKKNCLMILQLLIVISYWFQYSEKNFKIFYLYKPYIRSFSHIAEMIPLASIGLIFGYFQLIQKLQSNKKRYMFYSFILFYFINNYNIFGEFRGFPYSGIKNSIAAICLFIFFSLIPFQIINAKILQLIKIITRHTGGIYYFQGIIFNILKDITFYKKNSYFFKCITIYIFGYLLSFTGTLIFRKNKLKYLFN